MMGAFDDVDAVELDEADFVDELERSRG